MTLHGILIGFTLGTLLFVWVALWWLLVRAVHRWWWRLEDRAIQRIKGRGKP